MTAFIFADCAVLDGTRNERREDHHVLVEGGHTFRLGMTIAKMRGNPVNRVTHEVEVLDRQGMRVLPRALPVPPEQQPFSSYAGLVSRAPERRKFTDAANERKSRDRSRR